MRIVLQGKPITKKNSQRILHGRGGRPFISPSAQYKAYAAECIAQIPAIAKQRINDRVQVQCVYYMPTLRAVDLTNLLEATDDILVAAGVLEDDNSRIIVSHDGSRVKHDKKNPRVEVVITRYQEEE